MTLSERRRIADAIGRATGFDVAPLEDVEPAVSDAWLILLAVAVVVSGLCWISLAVRL